MAPRATAPAGTASAEAVGSISRVVVIEAERKRTAEELARISNTISLTKTTLASLDTEIAALAKDRARISQAMIAAASAQKAIEKDIAATERRISALAGDEGVLKASLRSRRGLLAEVLGALQRMGRTPPPALLVKPDDALGSVRSAILLGAVVPGIRKETERLVADLDQLASVKREIGAEKQRFVDGMTRQKTEEARLSRLFREKEGLEADNRDRRRAAAQRAAELASKATSLQDLVASLETEADGARRAEAAAMKAAAAERALAERRAAEAARMAEAARLAAIEEAKANRMPAPPDEGGTAPNGGTPAPLRSTEEPPLVAGIDPPAADPGAGKTYDVASLRRDMPRIESTAAFSTLKKRLSTPVSGDATTVYGTSDGIGRPASGTTFSARAGDLVTAPADGQVLYSGPFRSYGQLLILDAGDGYHVVLAGMADIDVEVGQFVLSGEPVAVMGARRLASAAAADFEAAEPSLYVEFRKDGKPVDPSPWWTEGPSGRTRNDS